MLPKEDIEFIKQNLGTWLTDASLSKPAVVYEIELRERMIRVEEELKHQRELMQQGFAQNEKRFEQVDKQIAQMDKQIELLRLDMDKRFEQVDKRFEQMDHRFNEVTKRMDRFMLWSFTTTLTVGGLVVAILKFWH